MADEPRNARISDSPANFGLLSVEDRVGSRFDSRRPGARGLALQRNGDSSRCRRDLAGTAGRGLPARSAPKFRDFTAREPKPRRKISATMAARAGDKETRMGPRMRRASKSKRNSHTVIFQSIRKPLPVKSPEQAVPSLACFRIQIRNFRLNGACRPLPFRRARWSSRLNLV